MDEPGAVLRREQAIQEARRAMGLGTDEVRYKRWARDEIEVVYYKGDDGLGSIWTTEAGLAAMMQHMVGVFFVDTGASR